jgi:hypothetical protein
MLFSICRMIVLLLGGRLRRTRERVGRDLRWLGLGLR